MIILMLFKRGLLKEGGGGGGGCYTYTKLPQETGDGFARGMVE